MEKDIFRSNKTNGLTIQQRLRVDIMKVRAEDMLNAMYQKDIAEDESARIVVDERCFHNAILKLEEAVMWATKSFTIEQPTK